MKNIFVNSNNLAHSWLITESAVPSPCLYKDFPGDSIAQ
jgi:hypothetical protein